MESNEILKDLRESNGLTMREVSEATGMATSLISDYETGKKAIGMKVAVRFADFYNVSLDYLLGRTTVKHIATEPTPEDSERKERIIAKYEKLSENMRALCMEMFRQISTVMDAEIAEAINREQKSEIRFSPAKNTAIARDKNNPYREPPTPEQLKSFTPVPEDNDL